MKLLIAIIGMVLSLNINAMEFLKVGGTFSMHGEIKHGDAINFLNEFASWEVPPTIFFISSNGGDLDEAIKIGEVIRKSQIPVHEVVK